MVATKNMSKAASAGTIRRTGSGSLKFRNNSKFPAEVCNEYTISNRSICLKRNDIQKEKDTGKGLNKFDHKCIIACTDPKIYPKVMTKKEYEYFKERSRIISKEEREAAVAAAEEEMERLTKESMLRKEEMRRMDIKRREKDAKISEIEEEARRRTMHILERADNLKLEQEEEIQKCNRLILETKCRAIRDAQIAERKLIGKELAEEEKRLSDMMENERRWAIKEDLKKEQKEMAKRQEFAKVLKNQIVENEEQRILEFERKQEESRLINLSNIAWQEEEIAKLRNKEIENAKVRQELAEGNEQLKHFKAMEEEENRIVDLRIRKYQQLKAEREAKIAEEQKLEELKKEREKAMIAVQTKQAKDLQDQIDEINAARVQEEVEREWRRKEKEEALKRAEIQKILQVEREKQINNKRIMQAVEIERDKREFEKILHMQKQAFCREKEELEKRQQKALMHRSEILKQMNEKERERIQARQKMFEEGLAIRTEAAMRKKKLRDTMERKCQEMRDNKVPEMYINEVKRMIENIQ